MILIKTPQYDSKKTYAKIHFCRVSLHRYIILIKSDRFIKNSNFYFINRNKLSALFRIIFFVQQFIIAFELEIIIQFRKLRPIDEIHGNSGSDFLFRLIPFLSRSKFVTHFAFKWSAKPNPSLSPVFYSPHGLTCYNVRTTKPKMPCKRQAPAYTRMFRDSSVSSRYEDP